MPATYRAGPTPQLEKIRDLVDRTRARLVLVGKALSELAAVTLTTNLKVDKVADTDASVAANSVRQDLSSIKKLVEVRSAEAKTFSHLCRCQRRLVVERDEISAFADALREAQQDIAKLRRRIFLGERFKMLDLLDGQAGGRNGVHTRPLGHR